MFLGNRKLLNVGLLLVIAFLSFQLIWEIRKCRKGSYTETFPEKVSLQIPDQRPLSYFSVIEERNLLGVSKQPEIRGVERGAIAGFRLRDNGF